MLAACSTHVCYNPSFALPFTFLDTNGFDVSTILGIVVNDKQIVSCAVQAGQHEVLIDKLPGMPDGVDASPTGGYCKCITRVYPDLVTIPHVQAS